MASNEFSVGDRLEAEVITIYVATHNSDGTEGKGYTVDHSYHLTRHMATVATSGIGPMGTDGEIIERLAIVLSDARFALLPKLIEISENTEKEAELRKKAMSKLSQAELAALLGSKTE